MGACTVLYMIDAYYRASEFIKNYDNDQKINFTFIRNFSFIKSKNFALIVSFKITVFCSPNHEQHTHCMNDAHKDLQNAQVFYILYLKKFIFIIKIINSDIIKIKRNIN
jgi:hypothetical protein